MKKLIIGMLIIIPILVILVVNLTASLLVGSYIAVEDVEIWIKQTDGKEAKAEDTMVVYLSDGGMQLIAKVIPTKASNKDVTWSVIENNPSAVSDEGLEIDVVTVDKNGYVKFENLGSAVVQVVTDENNVKATLELYVTSSDVMGIAIEESDELKNITVGDRVAVTAQINPADAKVEQKYLKWEITSGKDFATIDKNGIVTALKEGNITIKVSLANPPENLEEEKTYALYHAQIKPHDTADAFINEVYTYTSGTSMPLANVINSGTALSVDHYETTDNASVVDGNIVLNEAMSENCVTVGVYAVDSEGRTLDSITVNFKCVNISNTDLWDTIEEDGKKYILLKTGSAGIYLPVETSISGTATYASDNPDVAYYDETLGCLIAKSTGVAKISVSVGAYCDSVEVMVIPSIYSLGLYYSNNGDELGIEMTRVFGKSTYYSDGTVRDTLNFELRYYITTVGDKTVLLSSTEEINKILKYVQFSIDETAVSNGYSISDNGILYTSTEGNEVTVSVEPKYPIYETIKVESAYTVKFVDNGVNIGMPTKDDRENEDFDENQFSIDGFNKVNALAKEYYDLNGNEEDFVQKYVVVVQDGIIFGGKTNELYTSVYGNGQYLRQVSEDYSSTGTGLDTNNKPFDLLRVMVDDILIQNVTIRASRSLKDGESLYDYNKAGNGIMIDARYHYFPNGEVKEGKFNNIQVKYTTVENAYYCMYIAASDVLIEGTLMRNSGQQTLYVDTSIQNVGAVRNEVATEEQKMNSDVVLKNTVFTNAINMSIGIITADLDDSYDNRIPDPDIMAANPDADPNDQKNRIYEFELYYRSVTPSNVSFEGFCRIYNWKTAAELDFGYLRAYFDSDSSYNTVVDFLRMILNNNVGSYLDNLGWGDLYMTVGGTTYFQLAVGNLGVHYPVSGIISNDDLKSIGLTGLATLNLYDYVSRLGLTQFANKVKYPLYFYAYNKTSPTVGPTDVCTPNAALYRELVNGEVKN